MRILFLGQLFPLPMDSGGKIKSYYTIKTLAENHTVRVLTFVRSEEEISNVDKLSEICEKVDVVPLIRDSKKQFSDLLTSVCFNRSFIISRDFRTEMKKAYDKIVEEFKPDIVHIDHLQTAQFVNFKNKKIKYVMDNHNVESMILKRIAETDETRSKRLFAGMEWKKLQRYEIGVCAKSDLVLTVSEEDKKTICSWLNWSESGGRIETVPIGVDTEYFTLIERKKSKNILSIATMHWPPNVDAMLYFCREIYPLVKSKQPDCTLTIAGQKPVYEIQALSADESVKVTGYIDDSRKESADCGVFIVPLRSGSGVRVKILNAFAMGLPVVSTSIGAEGLDVVSGEHLLLADTPQDFADAVLEVLNNPELADKLGKNGRQLVCEKYSWDIVGKKLIDVYGKII